MGSLAVKARGSRERGFAEALENGGGDFGVGHVADVLVAVDRVEAGDIGIVEAEEHQAGVLFALQEVAAGTPFQAAPLLLVEMPGQRKMAIRSEWSW